MLHGLDDLSKNLSVSLDLLFLFLDQLIRKESWSASVARYGFSNQRPFYLSELSILQVKGSHYLLKVIAEVIRSISPRVKILAFSPSVNKPWIFLILGTRLSWRLKWIKRLLFFLNKRERVHLLDAFSTDILLTLYLSLLSSGQSNWLLWNKLGLLNIPIMSAHCMSVPLRPKMTMTKPMGSHGTSVLWEQTSSWKTSIQCLLFYSRRSYVLGLWVLQVLLMPFLSSFSLRLQVWVAFIPVTLGVELMIMLMTTPVFMSVLGTSASILERLKERKFT